MLKVINTVDKTKVRNKVIQAKQVPPSFLIIIYVKLLLISYFDTLIYYTHDITTNGGLTVR